MQRNAKVYIAGAGPGNIGLITVRAAELIKTCDIIMYDSLVNPLLLKHARKDAEKIFCGKRGGEESFPQEKINEMMVEYSRCGKTVLRLKGGDPWLFSRGSEEVEYLSERGVSFEIVPGVTSAIAAPAFAGIPVTHRNTSSSVAFVTGHAKDGASSADIEIPKADTLVYLMAISNLGSIVGRLRESGYERSTKCALVENGSTGHQRTITGTLEKITQSAQTAGIHAPAIFIVGDVVGHREQCNWFEKLPLFGKTIVVTRPEDQADGMISELVNLGADVVAYPAIEILPCHSREGGNPLGIGDPGSEAGMTQFTDIIFSSENGVRIFFEHLNQQNLDSRRLAGINIIAIGPETSRALKNHGIITDAIPHRYMSEGVLEILPKDLAGRKFLLPRSESARNIIDEGIIARGGEVTVWNLYKIVKPQHELPDISHADAIIFTSSMIVKHVLELSPYPETAVAFCISEVTAEKLPDNITKVIAKEATTASIINGLVNYYSNNSSPL